MRRPVDEQVVLRHEAGAHEFDITAHVTRWAGDWLVEFGEARHGETAMSFEDWALHYEVSETAVELLRDAAIEQAADAICDRFAREADQHYDRIKERSMEGA